MYEEKVYQVALSLVPGIGDILIKQLIAHCGNAEKVFAAHKGKLSKIPRVGKILTENIHIHQLLAEAQKQLNICSDQGIRTYFYTDKEYPSRLKQVLDAPSVLYFKGKPSFENRKAVAIVGTRNASAYGKKVTEEIVRGLSAHDALIISGLAYGIDYTAHKSALECDLSTIAVIAGGINKIYPSNHNHIARQALDNGGILTEQPWDTIPEAHHFPRRNRIIAGMTDVTLVVEAAKKGGALITAEYAHSYDRDLFAVPGNLHNEFSEGCNHLIGSLKAHIYTGLESLEKVMNWDMEIKPTRIIEKFRELNEHELLILDILRNRNDGMHIDEISWRTQLTINQMATLLLNLEFKGIVRSLPGKLYRLQ